jgi:hypothetical protein
MVALGFETISLRLLPWRSIARRIGGRILRQSTTRTRGLLSTRLVAAPVSAVRGRDRGEGDPAECHTQGHNQCRNQQS